MWGINIPRLFWHVNELWNIISIFIWYFWHVSEYWRHNFCFDRVVVFNASFSNISDISWWSVLLVEGMEYPEKIIDLSQVTDKLYHMILYQVHLAISRIRTRNLNPTTIRLRPWQPSSVLIWFFLHVHELWQIISVLIWHVNEVFNAYFV